MKLTIGRRFFTACTLLCAVAIAATSAKAGVIVEAQGPMTVASVDADPVTGAFSIDYTLQDPATTVLVIGTYMDNNGTSGEQAAANGISYNGVLADHTISSLRTTLSYWSTLPGSTGTYQLTGTAAPLVATGETVGYYAWELSNVDLSLGVDQAIITTAGANAASTVGSISTTSGNRLVTDFYGANKQGATTGFGRAAGSIIDTPATDFALRIANTALNTNTGTVAGGTGFAAASPGPHTLGWTATSDTASNSTRELAFAFAAIPEPSSLMLLVGGVLMIAGRRRIVG